MGYVPNMAADATKITVPQPWRSVCGRAARAVTAHGTTHQRYWTASKIAGGKSWYDITFVNRNLNGRTTYLEHYHYQGGSRRAGDVAAWISAIRGWWMQSNSDVGDHRPCRSTTGWRSFPIMSTGFRRWCGLRHANGHRRIRLYPWRHARR